jgi:DNA-binding transcriptional ArsR family regulator
LVPDRVDRVDRVVRGAEVDVFVAIASPVRRALLDTLSAGPRPVRDLAAEFSISRPAVSQHLRILKEASLVSEERFGRERRYQLNPSPLREVGRWLTHYEGFWRDRLSAPRDVLEEQP